MKGHFDENVRLAGNLVGNLAGKLSGDELDILFEWNLAQIKRQADRPGMGCDPVAWSKIYNRIQTHIGQIENLMAELHRRGGIISVPRQ